MSVVVQPPPNWNERRVFTFVAVFCATTVVVLCAAWSVLALSRKDWLTATFTTACGLGVGLIVVGAVRTRLLRRVTPRGYVSSEGTTLLSDRFNSLTAWFGFAAIFVAGAIFVVYVPQRKIDIALTDGQRIFFPIGVGLILILLGYQHLRRRRYGPAHLSIQPDGAWLETEFGRQWVAWTDVSQIVDRTPNGKSSSGHPIVVHRSGESPFVFEYADGYTPGGAALYWMLRHYWLNPGARDELTDGRALARFIDGDFPSGDFPTD